MRGAWRAATLKSAMQKAVEEQAQKVSKIAIGLVLRQILLFVSGFPFASERKNEFATEVVVSHHDVHLPERLVAAQLRCTLDALQIQSGVGITSPVLAASIIEVNSSMSQHHMHSTERNSTLVNTPGAGLGGDGQGIGLIGDGT